LAILELALIGMLIAIFSVGVSAAQAWVLSQEPPRGRYYAAAAVGLSAVVPVLAAGAGIGTVPVRDMAALSVPLFTVALLTTAVAFASGAGRRGVRARAATTFADRLWFLLPVHIGIVFAGAVLMVVVLSFFVLSRIH
jgi:hypothetical protein